ncbi:MAG: carboxylate-amine ligase [Pseudomonadota bacterium]
MSEPSFTLGIEEEYFLVDRESRELVREPDVSFLAACQDAVGDRVTNEFLLCQIEVGTKPHRVVGDAIRELGELRSGISAAAERFGYAPIAASTHPFSAWRRQRHTPKERYDGLAEDLGQAARRMLIGGMHIHIGIEDDDLRVDLMNQVSYFVPHFLALSCSSPFWEGDDTGLASYRMTVFDALPRTGLPDLVTSHTEYRRLVGQLVGAGCIEDATKIWWDVRPSDRFPTLEIRVMDVCARLRDAAAIAALYQSLIATLYRLKTRNQRWRLYPRTLIMENRWRAARYGSAGDLVDHGRAAMMPFATLVEELIDLTAAEAESLGCVTELQHLRRIAEEGTSAMRQRAAFAAGGGPGVVDQLIAEFVER